VIQVLDSKGQSSRSRLVQYSGNALLALSTPHLENFGTEFHETFSVDAFWDKDERLNVWGQKVSHGSRSQHDQKPSG